MSNKPKIHTYKTLRNLIIRLRDDLNKIDYEHWTIVFSRDNADHIKISCGEEILYARALNLLSHGKYSAYEPREMVDDTKNLFKKNLRAFLDRYRFDLPELITEQTPQARQQ